MSEQAPTDEREDAAEAVEDDPSTERPVAGADQPELFGMPRERAVRVVQIALVVVAVLVVGIVLLTRDSGSDDASNGKQRPAGAGTSAKDDGKQTWPSEVGGRPAGLGERGQAAPAVAVSSEVTPGVYLWSDYDGWHLWAIAGPGVPAIRGTLTSNDDVAKAELAVPDHGSVVVDGKTVTFELPADAPITGIDFNPGFFAKQLVFTLQGTDGRPLDQALVFLGSKAAPAPFPLVIEKQ